MATKKKVSKPKRVSKASVKFLRFPKKLNDEIKDNIVAQNKETIQTLVGKPIDKALKAFRGISKRITSDEGKGVMGDCSYRLDRINLHVLKGVVTRAYLG